MIADTLPWKGGGSPAGPEKAGLTKLVINEQKIADLLVEKRKDGVEVIENGVRYFTQKTY